MNGLASGKSRAASPDSRSHRAEAPAKREYVRSTEKVFGFAGKKRQREDDNGKGHPKRSTSVAGTSKGVFIPKDEMDARFKAGVCKWCGQNCNKVTVVSQ